MRRVTEPLPQREAFNHYEWIIRDDAGYGVRNITLIEVVNEPIPAILMSSQWLVQEWPHSRALGERWIAFPATTPSDQKWPGLHFFPSEQEARAYVAAHVQQSSS